MRWTVTSVKLEGKAFQRQSKSWTVIFWGRCLPSGLNLSEGGGAMLCLLLNHTEMLWCRHRGPGAAHSGPLSLWSYGTVLPWGPSGRGTTFHNLTSLSPVSHRPPLIHYGFSVRNWLHCQFLRCWPFGSFLACCWFHLVLKNSPSFFFPKLFLRYF